MKILVTGGAGFVGSHLVDQLLANDEQVLVIDNFATGRRDNLSQHSNLRVVEGTIADESLMASLFGEFEPNVVVHAAASYKDPENWEEDVKTNALGSAIVANLSKAHEVQRLIYFQTALCYGLKPLEQPITLQHPVQPWESSYAISKTAGEQYVRLSGVDFISFRLANAYGPRNLSGPLPTFFHRLTNDKPCFVMDTRRDFIYIDDLIGLSKKAVYGDGRSGFYHVSSGSDFAIKELFDAVIEALQIQLEEDVEVLPRKPDDAPSILLDPSVTNEEFKWQVTTDLNVGVNQTIAYYNEYGIVDTYTHLKQSE
ncbi:MAG: NAD-dependent epimerase/dehydratase family protein [Chloroflexi bacterium]|nr:MAG: NAD-dependent epimerase/dehydratase family protein [Chloroflexota bacterium]MBL1193119.1 NAD-dependent epimerase/dehydratase family protein [Chloroflexota bacterium]NOH10412.1 NAD-dependent epimerase/dehydratase family protein [Chloroflexota bacterium]